MPCWLINQDNRAAKNDGLSSLNDSYAEAMLRTFASLKPPSSIELFTLRQQHHCHRFLPSDINDCCDYRLIFNETSSLCSSISSIDEDQYIIEADLPLNTTKPESLNKFYRLLTRLDKVYNRKKMSAATILTASPPITNRYYFRSNSSNSRKARPSTRNKSNKSSKATDERYKFPSNNSDTYSKSNVYKFPIDRTESSRSRSIDTDRYYFPIENPTKRPRRVMTSPRSGSHSEQRSVTFEESIPTKITDTPYLFSKTSDTQNCLSTSSTLVHSEDSLPSRKKSSRKQADHTSGSPLDVLNLTPTFQHSKRLDTVTSTNGEMSDLKRMRTTDQIPAVQFDSSSISTPSHSYLNEARERLSGKQQSRSLESFDKSVDRLVSSVHKNYSQQPTAASPLSSVSMNYISQYYAKEDQPSSMDISIEISDDRNKFHHSLNTNRTHTQIMKSLNRSLIDRNYHIGRNRLKHLQDDVRRCLRSYENRSLQRELNYDLIRCFSTSYLHDLRHENIQHFYIRNQVRSYTYEDIQDIYVPSILESYKLKTDINRERRFYLHSAMSTGQMQLSGVSSNVAESSNENFDTKPTSFDTGRQSVTPISQQTTNARPNVDLFYEIMQKSFRGVDASIAGHVAKATKSKRKKSHQYQNIVRQHDNEIDVLSNSSFWSDDDHLMDHCSVEQTYPRRPMPKQRHLSRYLSTVNRSLLDRPSNLIADFYLSQLNRNMQDSVRNIETIAHDKAYRQEFTFHAKMKFDRSLSAEHLFQVRKEHIRYKQSFKTPTSFTTEDVTDIYKPFVLENYKRKIAIELERRRRARQDQRTADSHLPTMSNFDQELNADTLKATHPPIIDVDSNSPIRSCEDFLLVSPSNLVQTKEVVMGRARRTLTNDGSTDIIHHIGVIAPPTVYSSTELSSPTLPLPPPISTLKQRTTLTAMINFEPEHPYIASLEQPEVTDRKQKCVRKVRDDDEGLIDSVLNASPQVVMSHCPAISPHHRVTSLYSYTPETKSYELCQANLIEPEPMDQKLSRVTIQPLLTLKKSKISQYDEILHQIQYFPCSELDYQQANFLVSSEQPLQGIDQFTEEPCIEYREQKQQYEHGSFTMSVSEHMAIMQQETPIYENVQNTNVSSLSAVQHVGIRELDQVIPLEACQIDRPIMRYKSSIEYELPPYSEAQIVAQPPILYNDESETTEEIYEIEATQIIDDPCLEYVQAAIRQDESHDESSAKPLIVEVFHDTPPFVSLDELTTAITKQHANEIIDDNHFWQRCKNVEESIHVPIVIYDSDWYDENVESITNDFQSSIDHAQSRCSDHIQYEYANVNLLEQYICPSVIVNHEISEQQIEKDTQEEKLMGLTEQTMSLSEDIYLIHHQQQAIVHSEEITLLQSPPCPKDLLTLNYPQHVHRSSRLQASTKQTKQNSSNVSVTKTESKEIDSPTSSYLEMETFLNYFEESLDHEQHLPLVDQISISYATSNIEHQEHKYRALPLEWFKPTQQAHDEQLVEQWTVEKDIDTIQQEGTLRRQQLELINNTDSLHAIAETKNRTFLRYEKLNGELSNISTSTYIQENNHETDIITHCSPTSDYETDSVDKDNDTASLTNNNVVIVPVASTTNILPLSSITNTTLSSTPFTSFSTPTVPVVYFLDALANETQESNNATKSFLVTIGFGQHHPLTTMNELQTVISKENKPVRPIWVNRPIEYIDTIPTIIHDDEVEEISSSNQQNDEQRLHFATENQLEDEDTALILYSHRLQHGFDLDENIQRPLCTSFDLPLLNLSVINETYTYESSYYNEYPRFYPPDNFPNVLAYVIQDDDLIFPHECQIKQGITLSYVQPAILSDMEEYAELITFKRDPPTYIEHYHIQPLYSFPETCYAKIAQPDIILNNNDYNSNNNNNNNLLANILVMKFIQTENEGEINQLNSATLIRENVERDKTENYYVKLEYPSATPALKVQPSSSLDANPTYEGVSMQKFIDVNLGVGGQYKQQATYEYGNEIDNATKYSSVEHTTDIVKPRYEIHDATRPVPETVVEHISEDEKSTSSEEAFYEEWSEEFRCRRTEEYDQQTMKLVRTTMDETSERVKSDVLKEEYRAKNLRIKRHKSYDVVKEVTRDVPATTFIPINQVRADSYEEMCQSPPNLPISTTMSSPMPRDRQWSTEECYTTEVVVDSNLAKQIELNKKRFDSPSSSAHYDRVRTGKFSPIPTSKQALISTTPSSHYEQVTTVVTPAANFAELRRTEKPEQVVTEEYQVEIQQPKYEDISCEDYMVNLECATSPTSSARRVSDWRNRLKEIYTASSDEDRFDQLENLEETSSTPTTVEERQKKHDVITYKTDRPAYGRVGELKSTFETPRSSYAKDENIVSRYSPPVASGFTEQRRRIFEEHEKLKTEWTRRPINEVDSKEQRMSETHATTSLVADRVSHVDSSESKSPSRAQSNDRTTRSETDSIKSKFEISLTKPSSQTTIDIQIKNRQTAAAAATTTTTTSIDSDLGRPSEQINQTTPKTTKQKRRDDAGNESEDELSDPKESYDQRRRASKTRTRDFAQTISQPIETTSPVQRTIAKFNERNMENVLSHVPTSKGKAMLVELSTDICKSPIKSIHEPTKSSATTDSGIYDYSTVASQQLPTNSPTWRQNVSISVNDDGIGTPDKGVYGDSPAVSFSSSYRPRRISDTEPTTTQNIEDPISRSTYQYNAEISAGEPINNFQQSRTVRRQITSSTPDNYENLSSYRSGMDNQGRVPITTQSRSRKPLVIDEVETIETETHVECQIQRTNETKESSKSERTTSPKRIQTTVSCATHNSSDAMSPSRRTQPTERAPYYQLATKTDASKPEESVRTQEASFTPVKRDQSNESVRHSPYERSNILNDAPSTRAMEVTSLSSQSQITFGKNSLNEIVAIVRVPELMNDTTANKTKTPTTLRHGISEPELNQNVIQGDERSRFYYPRVSTTSYLPPMNGQQHRSRIGPYGHKPDCNSPVTQTTRSASYHSSLHDPNQQQQQQQQSSFPSNPKLVYRPPTRSHSTSLGNLLGQNIDFEIEIEKRPPNLPEQPTVVSFDQGTRAIVTTSKDGRVSIQNVTARPGNVITINSDFHSSDRSLNRSSGYFSSDEFRYQNLNTNFSSDEQINNQYQPKCSYSFDGVGQPIYGSTQRVDLSTGCDDPMTQIDALYNNLNVQNKEQTSQYYQQLPSTKNRRQQLSKNSNEYLSRYTSTGFQQVPYEQVAPSNIDNNTQYWPSSTSSLNNLVTASPVRPSMSVATEILADYGTSDSGFGSTQNIIVQQNRLNDQSQIVQRYRTSAKQVKQKSAAKKRHGSIQGRPSDEDDGNDSSQLDHGKIEERLKPTSRLYNFNSYYS